jgi:hypothetical protein
MWAVTHAYAHLINRVPRDNRLVIRSELHITSHKIKATLLLPVGV